MLKMFKKLKVVSATFGCMLLFMGAGTYDAGAKDIEILVDSSTIIKSSNAETVADLLKENNIVLKKTDLVNFKLDAAVEDDMRLVVDRGFMVNVNVDGSPKRIKVASGTVSGEVIGSIQSSMGSEFKLLGLKETQPLEPNMTLNLISVREEKSEIEIETPFEIIYKENAEMELGQENVLEEGVTGTELLVYVKKFEGDRLISETVVDTKVLLEPKAKIVEKGTKEMNIVPGTELKFTKVLTLNASAYTSDRGNAGTHTASGERARVGLVAVDPRVIPLGTKMYVEGYGVCKASDTGGAIKGNKIDLFFNTYNECVRFGRQDVVAYILE